MNRDLKTFLKNGFKEPKCIKNIYKSSEYESVPKKPGAYIFLSLNQKFIYPNGQSKVIYIGMSKNLKTRLNGHRRHFNLLKNMDTEERYQEWYYSRYQYMESFGGEIYYFTRQGPQDPKNLENKLLDYFYYKYLSLPVGNGAFSLYK
jgi:excinuclease UvrABC nuclease subunit